MTPVPFAYWRNQFRQSIYKEGVIDVAEPLIHGPDAGDHEAGDPASADDQLAKVGGLLASAALQTQLGQNERISLYRPVGEATFPGHYGLGIPMWRQEPSSPWPASTASPGRCAAAPRPAPSSGGTAPPAPPAPVSGRASQPLPTGPELVQSQLDSLAGRIHKVTARRVIYGLPG